MSRRYTDAQTRKLFGDALRVLVSNLQSVGVSPAERLAWLQEFAARSLQPPELDDAARQVNGFLIHHYVAWAGTFNVAAELQHLVEAPQVVEIQQAVKVVLAAVEPGQIVWFPTPVVDGICWQGDRVYTVTRAPGTAQVLAAVADLLAAVAPRLRRCETPTCRRLFVYIRPGQRRHVITCGAAERMKSWRDQQTKGSLSAQRHEVYARRVKKRQPNAKVARRPRKTKGEV